MSEGGRGGVVSGRTFAIVAIVCFAFLAGLFVVLISQRLLLQDPNYERSPLAANQLRTHYALTRLELVKLATGRQDADPAAAALAYDILYERLDSLPVRPPYDELLEAGLNESLLAMQAPIFAVDELVDKLRTLPPDQAAGLADDILLRIGGVDRDFAAFAS